MLQSRGENCTSYLSELIMLLGRACKRPKTENISEVAGKIAPPTPLTLAKLHLRGKVERGIAPPTPLKQGEPRKIAPPTLLKQSDPSPPYIEEF